MDAGNALFKAEGLGDAAARKKAAFLLETMGRLGTQAMAAGARDLVGGAEFLKVQAAKAKVPVLSANLTDAKGETVFPPSLVVTVGGVKVGLLGLSPMGKLGPKDEGLVGKPPIAAALALAKKLRPQVDVLVVLAAVPYPDALQLAGEAKESVDFILQSHEGRGVTPLQSGQGNFIVGAGERGRQLGRLVLDTLGKGPFVDAAEADRNRQTLALIDRQVGEVNKRLSVTKDAAARQPLEETLRGFTARRKTLEAGLGADPTRGRRTVRLEFWNLGPEYAGDPALEAAAKSYEPAGGGH